MRKKSAEPTIIDVAKIANVSIATVSRALNAKGNVRGDTAARVFAAMDELGYQYTPVEERPRNQLIEVVLPNLDNPFYAKIVKGISAAAKSRRYDVMIYLCKDIDRSLNKLLDSLRMINACGAIILSPVPDYHVLEQIEAVVPLVQCAEYNEQSALPYVGVDDYAAAKTAVEYLIGQNRRRVALINGPQIYKYARHRYQGYLDALRDAGLSPDPSYIFHVLEMGFDSALSVARQLLHYRVPPDAVLAASDIFASAVVKAASEEGLEVPREIAVIGFDNTYISSVSHPSITAVNMPQFQLGYMACELLAERILNPAGDHRGSLLNTELVIREST